jgi:hypothetical protein
MGDSVHIHRRSNAHATGSGTGCGSGTHATGSKTTLTQQVVGLVVEVGLTLVGQRETGVGHSVRPEVCGHRREGSAWGGSLKGRFRHPERRGVAVRLDIEV